MSESLLSEKEVMGEVYAVAERNLVKKIIIMKVTRRVLCIKCCQTANIRKGEVIKINQCTQVGLNEQLSVE